MKRRYAGSSPPVSGQYPVPEPLVAARTKALGSLLIEKGYLSSDIIDKVGGVYENEVGPLLGAKVVARRGSTLILRGCS